MTSPRFLALVAMLLHASVFAAPQPAPSGTAAASCPVGGEKIHWIADYCMSMLSTDDEIVAGECIGRELEIVHADDCVAKTHYKRVMCVSAIEQGTKRGSIDECVRDQAFVGSTVRNRGVGK